MSSSVPTTPFDHPPAGRTSSGRERTIGLDVARAVALIGVVVMNYHGMMNFRGPDAPPDDLLNRIFDIRTGVLTTRFAATFVVVAGISVVFLTSSDRPHGARLVRRGLVLLAVGYFLNEAWPGTILFYYGAYFVCAAVLYRLRSRHLAALSAVATTVAVGVAAWRRQRELDGFSTAWMNPAEIDSLRDFLLRVAIGYTHPLCPWLAFFCIGMLLGRNWSRLTSRPVPLALASLGAVIASYGLATVVRNRRDGALAHVLTAMDPNSRGLLYVVSTAGIAILVVLVLNRLAETFGRSPLVRPLQRAGQMTLSLYLVHVLFYYVVVEWFGWFTSTGLGAALLLALGYWTLAIAAAAWWHHRLGRGPAERIYRWLGG